MKIRNRLVLVILFVTFITINIFSLLQIKYQYDRDYRQFTDKIKYYDRLIAEFMRMPLWNLDKVSIEVGLDGFIAEPDIIKIDIRDNLGIIQLVREKPRSGSVIQHQVGIEHDRSILGTVAVVYEANIMGSNLRDAVFGFVLMEVILLLVLGGAIIVAAFTITKPLYRIIGVVQDSARTGSIIPLDFPLKGELADLADSINKMSNSLRERELSLQKISAESAAQEMKLKMERELRRQSDIHRQELQVSLDTLKQTRDQLITSEKMALLGSLVAGVSHEINTPIGVSVTAASYLHEKTREYERRWRQSPGAGNDHGEFLGLIKESLALVLENLDRAATLIRSFKQVSVDQASESIRVFDIGIYIHEIIHSLQPQLRQKEIDIHVDCPQGLMIKSFPGAFSQIITNLIINSLVHGFRQREGGEIAIKVQCLEPATITLSYMDDGCGMDQAALKHLFEPFYTSMRNSGGSGLGTYIIYNQVTQQLNGTIQASILANGGLLYKMEFPVDLISPGSPQQSGQTLQSHPRPFP